MYIYIYTYLNIHSQTYVLGRTAEKRIAMQLSYRYIQTGNDVYVHAGFSIHLRKCRPRCGKTGIYIQVQSVAGINKHIYTLSL